jgi:RNA polymerase sigma factor (sigma-70 family)
MMRLMKHTQQQTEDWNEVLRQIATGDQAAFGLFFDHFAPRVKSFSHLKQPGADLQAEELVQEVMIKVWDKAHTFNAQLSSASTWLFTMARNCQIDQFRRARSHLFQSIEADDLWFEQDTEPDPFQSLQQLRAERSIRESLKTLPQEQLDILTKVYMEGRTQQEIALELNVPLGTVKSRARLALKKLEKLMRAD